jgi:hypothetical protein
MGVIQNIADKFWMTIGKTQKVYPVQVEKHRVQGDEIVFDEMDRGRTMVDDQGNKHFELLNERKAEGLVKYEDFEKTKKGDNYVSLAMITRDKFVPLNREYNLSQDTYLDEDQLQDFDVEENSLEYVLSVSTFLEWADQHIEQSWKITETDTEKWWQQPKMQSAILFIGAGLFFVLTAFAQGELYIKPFADQLASLETALEQSSAGVGGATGGGS